jgi:hypothetical protein
MNKLLIRRQVSYERLNVLLSSLLNNLNLFRLKRRYRLLSERGNSREAFKSDIYTIIYTNLIYSIYAVRKVVIYIDKIRNVRICPFPSPMRATKESNDFTSGEIIGRLPCMRAVRDKES